MKIRALLAMVLCAMGLVLVTGCDSPEKGFTEWKEAIVKGDVAKAKDRSTKKGEGLVDFIANDVKKYGENAKFRKAEVVDCSKDGDTATLSIKVELNKEKYTGKAYMVKESGKWKVDRVE